MATPSIGWLTFVVAAVFACGACGGTDFSSAQGVLPGPGPDSGIAAPDTGAGADTIADPADGSAEALEAQVLEDQIAGDAVLIDAVGDPASPDSMQDSVSCQLPATDCSGQCVMLDADPNNCGACGVACTGGRTCQAGACSCVAGLTLCSGVCVDTKNDPANCGACDTTCASSADCAGGTCTCAGNETLCSGTCVDITTSETNCGGCGIPCPAPKHCANGKCN